MAYRDELEAKLQAARQRVKKGREAKALKDSAPTLYEIMDSEISLELNRGYNDDKPLPYDDYLESHGAVRGIRRIRNLLDSAAVEEVVAAQEVKAIQDNIKLMDDGKK